MRATPSRGSLSPCGWIVVALAGIAGLVAGPLFGRIPVTWDVDSSVACGDAACTPCCTIQGAVAKCIGGDSVRIFPGVYAESVDLSAMQLPGDLTVFADSGPGTVTIAPVAGKALWSAVPMTGALTLQDLDVSAPADDGVDLQAGGDIVIIGLVASGNGGDGLAASSSGGSVSLSDTTANANSGRGFDLDADTGITIVGSRANSNTGTGMNLETLGAGADILLSSVTANSNGDRGINLDGTNDATIESCTASGNGGRGVDASASADVTVLACTTNDNQEQGLALRADQDIVVDGCDSHRSVTRSGIEITGLAGGTADSVTVMRSAADDNGTAGESGIKVTDVAGTVVVGSSQASGNSQWGFDLRNQGNIYVLTCAATNNADNGFTLDVQGGAVVMRSVTTLGGAQAGIEIHGQSPGDAASVLVEVSDIRNSSNQGLDLEDLSEAGAHRVYCVNFVGNATNGLILRGDVDAWVDAEHNWWGAADGPSGIGPGSGDAIDQGPGTVDYGPWLTGPFETTAPCQQIFGDDWESGTTAAWVGIVE